MEENLRIGHSKDAKDGKPVYFAFVPKDEESDRKIQDLIMSGTSFFGNQELDGLTLFHVEDKNVKQAARLVREKFGPLLPFDPFVFWQSRCPWLLN